MIQTASDQKVQRPKKKPMTNEMRLLYEQAEPLVMPIIQSSARRLARKLGESPDDLIQEAREALAEALQSYDYNRSRGGIHAYAREAIRTAMFNVAYRAASRGRTRVGQDGTREWVPIVSTPTDEMDWKFAADAAMPDDISHDLDDHTDFNAALAKLKMRLLNGLSGHHADVFRCLYHPDEAFQAYLRNKKVVEASNVHVSEYLGLSKNVIDWSVHKIKHDFTLLAEEELSSFVGLALSENKWPMIYKSDRREDADLIRTMIDQGSLDPRPTDRSEACAEGARRVIETYPWGAAIFLELDDKVATLVVEGRFNARSGEVIAEGGHWKSVTEVVDWYPILERKLRKVA